MINKTARNKFPIFTVLSNMRNSLTNRLKGGEPAPDKTPIKNNSNDR